MSNGLAIGQAAPELSVEDAAGRALSLAALAGRAVVVRFFRHLGCPICRMEMAQMGARAGDLAARGAAAVVLVDSPAESVRDFARERAGSFALVADPERRVYGAWGVERGSIAALLSPGAAAKAARATLAGYLHGRFEGHELQLPADFVVDGAGRIAWARYGRHVGDNAPFDELLAAVDALSARAGSG